MGAVAGILYAFLIPLVMSSIAPKDARFGYEDDVKTLMFGIEVFNYKLALIFLFSCLGILFLRSLSEILLVRVATSVAKDIRMNFYQRISSAPYVALEQIGMAKIMASINIDIPRIVAGGRAIPALMVNGITLVGMLSFLMYLNFDVFKLVIISIVIGAVSYQIPILIGNKIFKRTREIHDDLQESIKGLIFGSKELKLDSEKCHYYIENILGNLEDSILANEKKAQTILRLTISFGDLISFLVIGIVCFIFVNYYSISSSELLGVVMALLYVTGPIAVLLGAIPQLAVSNVSFNKLHRLLDEIPDENIAASYSLEAEFNTLRFEQVSYSYPNVTDETGFKVGPLSFEMKKGQITFIVGSNGSGKSTLSKLITLHYWPKEGTINFGEQAVNRDNIRKYRQQIAAIYTDYYLFDRLLRPMNSETERQVKEYLVWLQLDKKVTVEGGQFSTLSLSDGQKKRLALLVALLADKQIYLFDEWAADQDPLFKEVFYTKILPELKAKNKLVIVISHDERYFNCADQILIVENGLVVSHDPATSEPLLEREKVCAIF